MLILIASDSPAARAKTASDPLIDAAWKAWQVPDFGLAERQFRAAIDADPSSPR